MGIGDEIMALGEARRLQERDPRPVLICRKSGKPRWCWVWDGSERVLRPEQAGAVDHQVLVNAPGRRPYIDYARTVEKVRWAYTNWSATPADLAIPAEATAWAAREVPAGCVVIEPHVKVAASPNKQWGWQRWQGLVNARRDLLWVQLGLPESRALDGVQRIVTPHFWQAAAALARARAAVLPEGGLHHVAAALGLPAVVLFGHLLRPLNTGYAGHVNVAPPDSGCGWRVPCRRCAEYWDSLSPIEVASMLGELLTMRSTA